MTHVVRGMRELLCGVSDFDVSAYMNDSDQEGSWPAYSYLNEHDTPEHINALFEAVVADDLPFDQYWGLLAVAHQPPPAPPPWTTTPAQAECHARPTRPGYGSGTSPVGILDRQVSGMVAAYVVVTVAS